MWGLRYVYMIFLGGWWGGGVVLQSVFC